MRLVIKKSKGQAAVETALVLPLLVILLFGIVSIGWWLNVSQVATNAVNQAASVGAASNDNCQIIATINAAMASVVSDINKIEIGVDPVKSADRARGSFMTVQARYPLGFGFGFLPGKFKKVSATAITKMDYYTDTGEPLIPADPECTGETP